MVSPEDWQGLILDVAFFGSYTLQGFGISSWGVKLFKKNEVEPSAADGITGRLGGWRA